MAADDDDDPMLHAADEPTAMWGADDLAELGLGRPPSEPPKGPAQPAAGGHPSSVKIASSPASPAAEATAPKRSQALQWTLTLVGALVLAAAAFFIVRALR